MVRKGSKGRGQGRGLEINKWVSSRKLSPSPLPQVTLSLCCVQGTRACSEGAAGSVSKPGALSPPKLPALEKLFLRASVSPFLKWG